MNASPDPTLTHAERAGQERKRDNRRISIAYLARCWLREEGYDLSTLSDGDILTRIERAFSGHKTNPTGGTDVRLDR